MWPVFSQKSDHILDTKTKAIKSKPRYGPSSQTKWEKMSTLRVSYLSWMIKPILGMHKYENSKQFEVLTINISHWKL